MNNVISRIRLELWWQGEEYVSCQKLIQRCHILSRQIHLYPIQSVWVVLDVPALYEAPCGHKGWVSMIFALDRFT